MEDEHDATRRAVDGILDFNFHKPIIAGKPRNDEPDAAYDNMRRVHRHRANRQMRLENNPYSRVHRNEFMRGQSTPNSEEHLRGIDAPFNDLAQGSMGQGAQPHHRPHTSTSSSAGVLVEPSPSPQDCQQHVDQLTLSQLRRAREDEARARREWEHQEACIRAQEELENRAREDHEAQAARTRAEQCALERQRAWEHEQAELAAQRMAQLQREEQERIAQIQQEELRRRRLAEEQARLLKQEEETRIRAAQEEAARIQREQQELIQQQQQEQEANQQQQAMEQESASVSGGAVGSTASAAPTSTFDAGGGKTYLDQAQEIIAHAEQCHAALKQFMEDPRMKPARLDVRKVLNMGVSQISALKRTIEKGASQLCEILSRLKGGGDQQLYMFGLWKSVDLLADTSLNIQAKSDATDAWPVAHVCARIFIAHPDAFTIFKGLMYQRCRYLIPSYEHESGDKDEEDLFRRTVGYQRLWFALMVLRKDYNLMWAWWSRVSNAKVRRITPSLIVAALEISAHSMQQRFGRQWKKLVDVIRRDFLPQAEELREAQPALISSIIPRVVKWLETYGSGRQIIPQPPGKDIVSNDELQLRDDI